MQEQERVAQDRNPQDRFWGFRGHHHHEFHGERGGPFGGRRGRRGGRGRASRGDVRTAVLQLLAEGRSNKEVAALLDLGLSTVETHRANLMQKLNLHNTAEIVLYVVRKGLIV